jgi:hypothetical protein
MGLIGPMIGLVLRSRERTGAFALILIAAASAGQRFNTVSSMGYDRVKGMADSEGQKWFDEHKSVAITKASAQRPTGRSGKIVARHIGFASKKTFERERPRKLRV